MAEPGTTAAPDETTGEAQPPPSYPCLSLDGGQLLPLLGTIFVLSLLIERALALVFEARPLNERLSKRWLKEPITLIVSLGVCVTWEIDVITKLVGKPSRFDDYYLGELVTAFIVAGGSKASLKLFRDVLGVRSHAEQLRLEEQKRIDEERKALRAALPPTREPT